MSRCLLRSILFLSLLPSEVCADKTKAVRVLLVGDATVASCARPPLDRADLTGWGQVLGEFFDEPIIIHNDARSGASFKSFIRDGLWQWALRERPAYIFIQFGYNDSHGKDDRCATDPAKDYQDNLKQYIDESKTVGALPVLITPVARRTFKEGKIDSSLQPYADAMKKVGKEAKVPVIDLHAASLAYFDRLGDKDSTDLSASAEDSTHFSRKGALALARLVVEALPDSVPELTKYLKFPLELVRFVPHKTNPVFAPAKRQWDAKIRERGWILREDGVYKLWYTGYDGSRDGIRRLGYATSADGIQWTRFAKNPLLRTEWVEDMMVVKDAGKYVMFAEGREDRAHMLVSTDGIAWTEQGKLDIRLANGKPIPDGPYGTPTVWRENERWYLFYERNDLGVWLASSMDRKSWQNVQDEPVMTPGPADYDRDLIACNQIIKHDGRYYAYYHGSAKSGPLKGKWCPSIATSKDLLHWEKYAGNPLVPIRANQSSGIVVHDGKGYRFYTMHPEVNLYVQPAK